MKTLRLTVGDRDLARQAFLMMSAVFETDGEPLSDEYLDGLLSQQVFWALVAVADNGRPVGALTAHELPMTQSETSELFIYDLAVRPDWQRRGVGRALVQHLIESADPARISSIFVPADNDDSHALDFYRALGGVAEAVTIFTFSDRRHGQD